MNTNFFYNNSEKDKINKLTLRIKNKSTRMLYDTKSYSSIPMLIFMMLLYCIFGNFVSIILKETVMKQNNIEIEKSPYFDIVYIFFSLGIILFIVCYNINRIMIFLKLKNLKNRLLINKFLIYLSVLLYLITDDSGIYIIYISVAKINDNLPHAAIYALLLIIVIKISLKSFMKVETVYILPLIIIKGIYSFLIYYLIISKHNHEYHAMYKTESNDDNHFQMIMIMSEGGCFIDLFLTFIFESISKAHFFEEYELLIKKNILNNTLNYLNNGLLIIDRKRRIQYMNQFVEKLGDNIFSIQNYSSYIDSQTNGNGKENQTDQELIIRNQGVNLIYIDSDSLINKSRKNKENGSNSNGNTNIIQNPNANTTYYTLSNNFFNSMEEINPNLPENIKNLFKKTNEDITSETINLIINNHDFMNENILIGVFKIKNNKNASTYELVNNSENNIKYYEISIKLITISDEEPLIEIFMKDITKYKLYEQEKALIKSKTTFMAKIAHEFKNPLICIGELTEQIREKINEFKINQKDKRTSKNFLISKSKSANKIRKIQLSSSHNIFTSSVKKRNTDDLKTESSSRLRNRRCKSFHLTRNIKKNSGNSLYFGSDYGSDKKNILIEENDARDIQLNLMTVKSLSDYIISLVFDFEVLAKKEGSSEIKPIFNKFDLKKELEFLHQLAVVLLNKNGLGVIFLSEVKGSIPNYIISDSLRIRQIIVNLLSNSIKFTHFGSIKLKVEKIIKNNSNCILFTIEDTGIGIENPKLLFNTSFKNIGTTNTYGTGLGLMIVNDLCKCIGGEIKFENNHPKGSKFTVAIPYKEVEESSLGLKLNSTNKNLPHFFNIEDSTLKNDFLSRSSSKDSNELSEIPEIKRRNFHFKTSNEKTLNISSNIKELKEMRLKSKFLSHQQPSNKIETINEENIIASHKISEFSIFDNDSNQLNYFKDLSKLFSENILLQLKNKSNTNNLSKNKASLLDCNSEEDLDATLKIPPDFNLFDENNLFEKLLSNVIDNTSNIIESTIKLKMINETKSSLLKTAKNNKKSILIDNKNQPHSDSKPFSVESKKRQIEKRKSIKEGNKKPDYFLFNDINSFSKMNNGVLVTKTQSKSTINNVFTFRNNNSYNKIIPIDSQIVCRKVSFNISVNTKTEEIKSIGILVVDDEKIIRNSIVKVIENYFKDNKDKVELILIEASDGIEALYALYWSAHNNISINFIYTDDSMKFMCGNEFTSIIEKMNSNGKFNNIDVNVISAYDQSVTEKRYAFKCVKNIFSKPFGKKNMNDLNLLNK